MRGDGRDSPWYMDDKCELVINSIKKIRVRVSKSVKGGSLRRWHLIRDLVHNRVSCVELCSRSLQVQRWQQVLIPILNIGTLKLQETK